VEANSLNNRRTVFSMICAARVVTQRCGNHISAAVNQHATIDVAVFSVGPPQEYVTRISRSSGVGSCSRELRKSAVEARKELGSAKKTPRVI
jgi:hypothetical protein